MANDGRTVRGLRSGRGGPFDVVIVRRGYSPRVPPPTPPPVVVTEYLLLQTGDKLELESGGALELN